MSSVKPKLGTCKQQQVGKIYLNVDNGAVSGENTAESFLGDVVREAADVDGVSILHRHFYSLFIDLTAKPIQKKVCGSVCFDDFLIDSR